MIRRFLSENKKTIIGGAAICWVFGVFCLFEQPILAAAIFHLSTLSFFISLLSGNPVFKIKDEKVHFWKRAQPKLFSLFSFEEMVNHGVRFVFFLFIPLMIWSNWWPYQVGLHSHNWNSIEDRALKQIEQNESYHHSKLKHFQSNWNDSSATRKYYFTLNSIEGILTITVNNQDSILHLDFKPTD